MFVYISSVFLLISQLIVDIKCDTDSNTVEFPSYTFNDITKIKPFESPLGVVSLKQNSYFRKGFSHFCTGSILSSEWILTAGHCFSNKLGVPLDRIVVDVGSEQLSNENGSRYNIANFFIHPNQSESIEIYRNDLCLIKLQEPITFTSKVQPVRLGTIKDQKELPVNAGGWGRVSQHGSLNKKLRFVRFNTLRYDECQRIHNERNNIVDRQSHICGYMGLGKSLCFGDSGGPLFDVATGYEVGVFSALEDCSGYFPVLFVKIEPYLNWINEVTKLNISLK